LYNTTPVTVNKIFYNFIQNGEIFAAKRLFKLCMNYKNVVYLSSGDVDSNIDKNYKLLTIININERENPHYLRNNKKFKKTVEWLNSLPASLPKALEPHDDDYY
jgi:hypothetical protein